MTAAPVIEVEDVHCSFDLRQGLLRPSRRLYAVQGISFSVARGETLGVVGESGCGKSTLGRIVLGVQAVSSGTVRVAGRPIAAWQGPERARRIQAVFQDPYSSLNPTKTVADIIGMPLRLQRRATPREASREVDRMLDLTGLPQHVGRAAPGALSGGQRQRVAIARALITRPEALVCDEPTSALDVSVQSQIVNLLRDLQREFGLAMIFISHNLAVVEHLADRVAVMYLGRFVEAQTAAGLFEAPRHPYTLGLLNSVLSTVPGRGIPDPRLKPLSPDPFALQRGCALHPRCPKASSRCSTEVPKAALLATGFVECHHPDEAKLGTETSSLEEAEPGVELAKVPVE